MDCLPFSTAACLDPGPANVHLSILHNCDAPSVTQYAMSGKPCRRSMASIITVKVRGRQIRPAIASLFFEFTSQKVLGESASALAAEVLPPTAPELEPSPICTYCCRHSPERCLWTSSFPCRARLLPQRSGRGLPQASHGCADEERAS